MKIEGLVNSKSKKLGTELNGELVTIIGKLNRKVEGIDVYKCKVESTDERVKIKLTNLVSPAPPAPAAPAPAENSATEDSDEDDLEKGQRVEAVGLKNAAHLNGASGTVIGKSGDRWAVKFDEHGNKKLRRANLVPMHEVEELD